MRKGELMLKMSWHYHIIAMLWLILSFEAYNTWHDNRHYVCTFFALFNVIMGIVKEFKEGSTK